MSFNLFGPASKDDIRVGYISTDRGLIEGVSICEANDYAFKNPGTRFIFRTRDKVRFLNINQVNDLQPADLEPKSSGDSCNGVQIETECGPPKVVFLGGGGVGAVGNPVIGEDGSVLAIDLIEGGYGYQYAPITEVKDNCGIGAGAIVRSVLGEIIETVETFDDDEDFEEYEFCDPNAVGFGRRYGPNGEDIGEWKPSSYTSLSQDPIRREIEKYQNFLQNIDKPFWSTRKEAPLQTVSRDNTGRTTKVTRSKFDVDFPRWNDFMNTYAISPVPPSNVVGSDFAGRLFTFEWEEEFPYDGEYTFRGLCDNVAELFFDEQSLGNLKSFQDTPKSIKKFVNEGVHKIKLNLLNVPIKQTIVENVNNKIQLKFDKRGSKDRFFIEAIGSGSVEVDVVVDIDDNKNFAGLAAKRIIIPSDSGELDFKRKNDYPDKETIVRRGVFTGGKTYGPIQIIGRDSNAQEPVIVAPNVLGLLDAKDDDINIKITIAVGKDSSVNAQTTREVVVESARSWNENPMGVALTIDAPEPPVPEEPPVVQEGRCPPNPIWSTRFPNSDQKWYPVFYGDAWSEFMNRYAISPVQPLNTQGSDGSGTVFQNSWNIEIPYDGFYGVKGTVDNFGRILIDGKEILGVGRKGATQSKKLSSFGEQNPPTEKVFLTKGSHTIEVEVENQKVDSFTTIDSKVFSTSDWISPPASSPPVDLNIVYNELNSANKKINVRGNDILLKDGDGDDANATLSILSSDPGVNARFSSDGKRIEHDGFGKVKLRFEWSDNPNTAGTAVKSINVGGKKFVQSGESGSQTETIEIKQTSTPTVSQKSGGVKYDGPPLEMYRTGFISPRISTITEPTEEIQDKTWIMKWTNVDFPESTQYIIKAEADDVVEIRIDGQKVGEARVFQGVKTFYVNLNAGKKTVELELYNIRIANSGFRENPMVASVSISRKVQVVSGISKPWTTNPVGISAILIPPPCPKLVKGRGVITDILVDDPGNGYLSPQNSFPSQGSTVYPVSLRLKSVEVEDSGINYSCGIDQIQITPSNGAVLSYECDTFGRISRVNVLNPGLGFTRYPEITISSNTGVNATFRPQFEVVRDPIVINPNTLIQVTDLVGLKQTGYVDGRPYYGAVFYKEGVRYAGFYETPGDLVQVYTTLQESIDAQVTTPPSAILRQGTDITSNDPRLNLPGTPDNLI